MYPNIIQLTIFKDYVHRIFYQNIIYKFVKLYKLKSQPWTTIT